MFMLFNNLSEVITFFTLDIKFLCKYISCLSVSNIIYLSLLIYKANSYKLLWVLVIRVNSNISLIWYSTNRNACLPENKVSPSYASVSCSNCKKQYACYLLFSFFLWPDCRVWPFLIRSGVCMSKWSGV